MEHFERESGIFATTPAIAALAVRSSSSSRSKEWCTCGSEGMERSPRPPSAIPDWTIRSCAAKLLRTRSRKPDGSKGLAMYWWAEVIIVHRAQRHIARHDDANGYLAKCRGLSPAARSPAFRASIDPSTPSLADWPAPPPTPPQAPGIRAPPSADQHPQDQHRHFEHRGLISNHIDRSFLCQPTFEFLPQGNTRRAVKANAFCLIYQQKCSHGWIFTHNGGRSQAHLVLLGAHGVGRDDHRCQRIRGSSSGRATPSRRGISRAV